MEKEKLSMAEFYQKYCNIQTEDGKRAPALRDADIEFFNMVEQAHKENKQIAMSRGRGTNWDAYITSLTKTAMQLTEGNKICLLSQKPDKFISDLKRFFNIDVNIEPSKVNGKIQEYSNTITLKKDE